MKSEVPVPAYHWWEIYWRSFPLSTTWHWNSLLHYCSVLARSLFLTRHSLTLSLPLYRPIHNNAKAYYIFKIISLHESWNRISFIEVSRSSLLSIFFCNLISHFLLLNLYLSPYGISSLVLAFNCICTCYLIHVFVIIHTCVCPCIHMLAHPHICYVCIYFHMRTMSQPTHTIVLCVCNIIFSLPQLVLYAFSSYSKNGLNKS